jgi:hypothetical protein
MIAAQKAGVGLSKGGRPADKTGRGVRPVSDAPTLADVGISKDLSSRAQAIAAVPEQEFEAEVGEWRERVSAEGARVTARLVNAGKKAKGKAKAGLAPSVESDSAPDLADEMERQDRQIRALEVQVAALSVADVQAELRKQIEIRQHVERQLGDEMNKNGVLHKELRGYGKWLSELCKITGQDSRSAITQWARRVAGQRAA